MKKLGLRATAREIGISHVALAKAESDGRVPRRVEQLFDVEACRAALDKNTNPVKSAQARKQQRKPVVPAVEQEVTNLVTRPVTQPVDSSLSEALRRKENALARLRELELAEKEGNLVALDDVERVWGQLISTCRQRLLGIPTSVAAEVAGESSPAACSEIIRTALYGALTELAEGASGFGDQTGNAKSKSKVRR